MLRSLARNIRPSIGASVTEAVRNRWHLLLVLFLGFAVLLPYIVAFDGNGVHVRARYLFLASGLTCLALIHRYTFLVICLALVPINLVHFHLQRHWGDGQLNSRIEAAFESPAGETVEYLRSHLDAGDAAMILLAILYVALLIYGTVFAAHRLPRLRRIAGIALLLWLAVLVAFRVDRQLVNFPPYRLVEHTLEARERYRQLKDRRDYLAQHPLSGRECEVKYDRVVIVLGESAISDRMSVFGHPAPTTPFAKASKPHAFEALSPSNQTRYALAMMLTEATPGRFDTFYRQHSLLAELRACGLHTLWVSNQGKVGEYDSFTTSLALEADEQIFLNEWSWTDTKFDEQIVTALAERDVYRRDRHVTFVHLIGSHTRYHQRFPADFGLPPPHDTVTAYDNSLLYTDFVLSELYRRFNRDRLLFIYVSDHGQIVSNNEFGSGFLPGYREEYRVPLLIWTDDGAAIRQVRDALGGTQLNTESLDDVVRFLLGLSDAPAVSVSRAVSVLTPEYVRQYDDLAAFKP